MWISIIVVVACMTVGFIYEYNSDKIDSPAEQVAETILDAKGIEIDFSRDKKKVSEQSKQKD